MGHILRADNNDPVRIITFEFNNATPIDVGMRRVGGPKKNRTEETMKITWENPFNSQYNKTKAQMQTLLEEAIARTS